jgi:pyrrolysine biosynthesis protein PylD
VTRLTTDDIIHIATQLADYDKELIAKTGFSLKAIACQAADAQEAEMQNILGSISVAVVPITLGEGIIKGFCDTVTRIVSHIGCNAFMTQNTDVAGLAEAFEKRADVIMLADDHRFVAIHTQSRQVVDNAVATGKGFATGLSLMVGGLEKKNVLIIGCGPVGCSATQVLIRLGSDVSVYDINSARSNDLAKRIKQSLEMQIHIVKELDQVLMEHRFIVDATPAADIIRANHITSDTYISAPGVPLGLDSEAQSKISNRLLHDPLQIGVATMAMLALKYGLQNG